MSQISNTGVDASDEIDLREIVKPYFRKWWWFILSIIVTLALAIVYIKITTPIYDIRSTVLIRDVKKSPLDFGMISDLSSFGGKAPSTVNNEIEIFKSKKLIKDVVQRLELQTNVFSEKDFKKQELYNETSPFLIKIISEKFYKKPKIEPVEVLLKGNSIELTSEDFKNPIITSYNKTVSLPYANLIIVKNPKFNKLKAEKKIGKLSFQYQTQSKTITNIQKIFDASLVDKDATVIGLNIKHENIEKGEAIINTLVDVFNNDATNDKNSESQKTKEFIDERISLISTELGNVETEKERFKSANQITDIAAEAQLNLGTSASTRARLLDTETQLAISNDLIDYLSKQASNQVLPSAVGLSNPTASANITMYNELIIERNILLENATPQNPTVIELSKQIANVRLALMDNLVKNRRNLTVIRNQMQNEQDVVTSKIRKIPTQEKMFRNIERQQSIKENLYLILLQKREETAISLANTTPKARIIDYAYAFEKPISPKKLVILSVALIFGFLIPFAFIYLKQLFDNKIKSKQDIEKLSPTSVLGEVPRLEKGQNELVGLNDLSPMAEALRILVTNMNFILLKKDFGKVLFVTSSVKGEGKTFVSINLALTLATPKNKVIIIGSDIRNPQLQRYNSASKGLKGLTEYLHDKSMKLEDVIHTSSFNPYCDIIYSGSIPPNPTELLSNGRYAEMIDDLRSRYNHIILDTAPLMLVTDTFLFANMADATLYVTRSGYSEKIFIDYANRQIETKKIKNVGFVLNDVGKDNFGYGNKYGYGYHAEEKSWFQKLISKS